MFGIDNELLGYRDGDWDADWLKYDDYSTENLPEVLEALNSKFPSKRILDIGCGPVPVSNNFDDLESCLLVDNNPARPHAISVAKSVHHLDVDVIPRV